MCQAGIKKSKKFIKKILDRGWSFFSFKGARQRAVHMGGLAKIGCEGDGFNFKKLNCINVKIVQLSNTDCTFIYLLAKNFEVFTNVYLMYLSEMTGAKLHIHNTWFSSAQSSFIPKFLVEFYDKICRDYTVLAKSKIQEAQNFREKKLCVSLEKDFVLCFHICFSTIFAIYFLFSVKLAR